MNLRINFLFNLYCVSQNTFILEEKICMVEKDQIKDELLQVAVKVSFFLTIPSSVDYDDRSAIIENAEKQIQEMSESKLSELILQFDKDDIIEF